MQIYHSCMLTNSQGSTCLCRPLYEVPASSAQAQSTPGTPSVTSTASTPGRVQKQSRRQSSIHTVPNNIVKALNNEWQQPGNGIFATQTTIEPNYSTNTSSLSSINVGTPEKPLTPELKSEDEINAPILVNKDGGCCSGESAPVAAAPQPRSCCAGPSNTENERDLTDKPKNSGYMSSWEPSSHMGQLLWNSSFQNDHYPAQSTNYPAVNHPSPFYVNQLHLESPLISQSHYLPNGASNNPLLFNSARHPPDMHSTFAGENSHACSCGENCQCLGCASHPFNETTRQHVQKMGYMMSIGEDDERLDKATPFKGQDSPSLRTPKMSPNGVQRPQAVPTFTDNAVLPSSFEHTLSSTDPFGTDGYMQPSEYYTIEYPVGLSLCSNVSGNCQCGNDCSCVGCLTHSGHNGVALETPANESRQTAPEMVPQQSSGYINYAPEPRALDQYSPSALSPPLVETPLV